MPRYVAFLRALNVGGRNVVPMARLAKCFVELGLDQVETFIASGNVIFTSAAARKPLEAKIAAHLARALGHEVATFLRTPAELAAVAGHRAFPKPLAGSTLYIGFLATTPAAAAKRQVEALASAVDAFHLHGTELYWRIATSISKSKVTGARLEKALGQPTTLRKITTVEKLAAKLA